MEPQQYNGVFGGDQQVKGRLNTNMDLSLQNNGSGVDIVCTGVLPLLSPLLSELGLFTLLR